MATATKTEVSACTLAESATMCGSKSNLSACSKLCEDQVRERAYQLWQEAGSPEGDGVQFWLDAEEQLQEDA